jgi:putative endonuclease
MVYVYVLYSNDFERYYVGMSDNVEKRLKEHNKGLSKSTKPYVPWRLVHSEQFETRMEARTREKYLKSAAGRRWRKKNIDMGD